MEWIIYIKIINFLSDHHVEALHLQRDKTRDAEFSAKQNLCDSEISLLRAVDTTRQNCRHRIIAMSYEYCTHRRHQISRIISRRVVHGLLEWCCSLISCWLDKHWSGLGCVDDLATEPRMTDSDHGHRVALFASCRPSRRLSATSSPSGR